MHASMEICVVPIGTELSLSGYVAACQRIFSEHGLAPQMHAFGTNIEGEWEVLMAALRQCHETLHAMGAPRLQSSIKLATRSDRQQSLQDKVESVRSKLEMSQDPI